MPTKLNKNADFPDKNLLAGTAHELRNSISVITAALQMIEKEFAAVPGLREYLSVLYQQVGRQNRLAGELLDLVRPAGPSVQRMPVGDLIKEALDYTMPILKRQDIKLIRSGEEGQKNVEVEVERVKQVFVNLILNAVQAMPGGGALTIRVLEDDAQVRIEFADTGEGIAGGDLPRVFDQFYTTKGEGAGLGLSVSRRIVREHRGDIEVAGTGSRGTVFTVKLPAARE